MRLGHLIAIGTAMALALVVGATGETRNGAAALLPSHAPTTSSGQTSMGGGAFSASPAACCVGTVGNVDCSPGDGVDIGDLTALIDNLFISFTPLCCNDEANCDGDPSNNVDIGDLTALIDNLFISFTPLPACAGQPSVSFAAQIQPIFTAHCAVTGCHTGPTPTGNQNLSAGVSYGNIVNVTSFGYAPAIRVVPGDTLASVLWNKVKGTGTYGAQMPFLLPPLSPADQALITAWITNGAPNN